MNEPCEHDERSRRRNLVAVVVATAVSTAAAGVVLARTSPYALLIVAGPSQVSAALRACGR